MEGQDDERVFHALLEHPHVDDLAALAWAELVNVMRSTSIERRFDAPASPSQVPQGTEEHATTAWGNAVLIMRSSPRDSSERTLVRALTALAFSKHATKIPEDAQRSAYMLLWLSLHTPFDATALVDCAFDVATSAGIWNGIATRIREATELPGNRAEALIGAFALVRSKSTLAASLSRDLARESKDPLVAGILGPDLPGLVASIQGEMASRPRGSIAITLRAVTGVALVCNLVGLVAKLALAYRRPAELSLDATGIRFKWRVEVLGRTLRDYDVSVPRSEIRIAMREVRYPSLGLYVGLLSLAAGSCIGLSTMADGLRVSSPPLLLMGFAVVAAGLALDFILWTVSAGRRGRCRVCFVPRVGRTLCVGGVDVRVADALLACLGPR